MEAVNEQPAPQAGRPAAPLPREAEWGRLLVAAERGVGQDRLEDAFGDLKRALTLAKEIWPGGVETAETYIRLGDVCGALDKSDAAIRMYGRGVELLQARPDGVTPRLAHAVSNMGRLLALAGSAAKASELAAAADALHRNVGEPDSPVVKLNLAIAAAEARRDDEATQAFKGALAAADRMRRAMPRFGIAAYDNFAAFHVSRNRSENAEKLLRRCLILRQEIYGPGHPVYAGGLLNLARLLYDCNAGEEAEPLLWQATEVYRRNDDQPVADLLLATYFIARIALELGRGDDAERLCQRLRAFGGADERAIPAAEAAALHIAARQMLDGTGRPAAEQPLRQALGIVKALRGGFRVLAENMESDILDDLASVLAETGKAVEAERLTARASELRQRPKWALRRHVFAAS